MAVRDVTGDTSLGTIIPCSGELSGTSSQPTTCCKEPGWCIFCLGCPHNIAPSSTGAIIYICSTASQAKLRVSLDSRTRRECETETEM